MRRILLVAMLVAAVGFCATTTALAAESAAQAVEVKAARAAEKPAATAAAKETPKAEGGKAAEASGLPTVESLLALLGDKVKDVKGLSADVRGTMQGRVMNGTMKCLAPDSVRMEFTAAEKGQSGQVASSLKMVIHNKVMYMEANGPETGGTVRVMKLDMVEMEKLTKEMAAIPGMQSSQQQVSNFITYLQAQRQAGATVKVLKVEQDLVTFEVRAKDAPPDARQEVTISTADGFMRSLKTFSGDNMTQEMTLSNVKTSNDFKAGDFAYTPPKGVQVDDFVKTMRTMMESMKEMQPGGPAPGGSK